MTEGNSDVILWENQRHEASVEFFNLSRQVLKFHGQLF